MAESQARLPDPFYSQDLVGARIGRFQVVARLGTGGMGEVYRAEDTRLHRSVALKRVPPWLRLTPDYRQRFLEEAQRASRIASPFVAAVYDVFEQNDELFLVLEYVEGETLRARMDRSLLAPEEALEIVRCCALGIAAAHDHGIIHCDIKPENIMLSPGGDPKVLDFGIARCRRTGDEATLDERTGSPGGFSGTPAYMAPEVLREHEPEPRSDIFSLGVVLYEMLTGANPFRRPTLLETANRILSYDPPPPSQQRQGVSEQGDAVIARMLAKDPADRYSSAREMVRDVGKVLSGGHERAPTTSEDERPSRATALAGVVAGVALIFGLVVERPNPTRPATTEVARDIAILPFSSPAEAAETRAFSDGLAETLGAKLTQIGDRYALKVVPPSEVRALNVTSAEQAHKTLGVGLVLQGSLRQSGDVVRVTYALVDARTHRQLRADAVTERAADPFAVEDRVVDSVLNALQIALAPQERQALATGRPAEPGAYDFYLQGRGYLQDFHKPENIESAITVFQRALEKDSTFAPAHAGLGAAYWFKYQLNKDSSLVDEALRSCSRAVDLNPDHAGAHVCLGTMYNGTGQYDRAAAEFQRAIVADPSEDAAYAGLGEAYENLGKLHDAEQTLKNAISLRPNYWAGYNRLGSFYFRNGRDSEAEQMFLKVTELAPDNFRGYSNLGGIYVAMGQYGKAIPVLERSVAIRPTGPAYGNLAAAYFYLRRFDQAARANEEALKLNESEYLVWGNLGEAYYWIAGKKKESQTSLRKAIALARKDLRVNPQSAELLGDVAWFHAMLGEKQNAAVALKRAIASAPDSPEVLWKAALSHRYLGDEKASLKWLEKATRAGYPKARILANPAFDSLAQNQSFAAIVDQQGESR